MLRAALLTWEAEDEAAWGCCNVHRPFCRSLPRSQSNAGNSLKSPLLGAALPLKGAPLQRAPAARQRHGLTARSRRRSRVTGPTSPRTGATPKQKPHRLPAPQRSPHLRRGQELPGSAWSRSRPPHLLRRGLGPGTGPGRALRGRGRALRGGVSAAPSRSPAPGPAPLSGYGGAAPSQHPDLHTNNPRACAYVTRREACQGRL